MMSHIRLPYRPEIVGLRAISIILVLLYHFKFELFEHTISRSGFIGVDIFFVISGYLITSLILTELATTDGFSFLQFYERRVRRILPALLVVMLVFTPIAWLLLLPTSITNFSKTILFSIASSSNYYFYNSQSNYFNLDESLNPFLHTWSLSIEEQFYLIFPVILVALYKYLRKRALYVLLICFGINLAVVQFLGNMHFASQQIALQGIYKPYLFLSSFYIPTSRIWEFLAGAILGYLEISRGGGRSSNPILNQLCPIIGIILIGRYVLYFNSISFHPSIDTFVMPVLGTCLLLWFLKKGGLVTELLSNPVLIGIGSISYSLYLYHYPLLIFFNAFYLAPEGKLFASVLTLLFSILSYKFVETPLRSNRVTSLGFLAIFLVGTLSVLVGTQVLIIQNSGLPSRFRDITSGLNYQIDNKYYIDEYNSRLGQSDTWGFKSGPSTKKVLIIGNSHGFDLFTTFEQNKELFSAHEFSYVKTSYIDHILTLLKNVNRCRPLKLPTALDPDIATICGADYLIMSPRWDGVTQDKLAQLLALSNDARKQLILTTNIPHFIFNGQSTLIDIFVLTNRRLPTDLEVPIIKRAYYDSYISNQWVQSVNAQLKSFAKAHNTILLDKSDLLCDSFTKSCEFWTPERRKLTFDGSHLTIDGAKYLGEIIIARNWLKLE